MANFNAMGGDLFAYGGNMKSPLTEFNAGGSHESNPNSGVMQGTGSNGQPNLVEQGETKHEDYIFSNRLKINPEITKEFKLPVGLNGKTFAAASKYLNKEAKERPNDPISNNAVKAQLAKLTAAQEGLKEQIQPKQQQGIPMEGQRFANGGSIDQTHYNNPTHQGANIYSGKKLHSSQLTRDNRFDGMEQLGIPMIGINQQKYANDQAIYGNKFNIHPQIKDIHTAIKEDEGFRNRNPEVQQQGLDYSRYAPVAANMITGISDMFQTPEAVKYGRVSPEMNTSHMDYEPIDTNWMQNKMNSQLSANRSSILDSSSGNRGAAMAGLLSANQQGINGLGESYLNSQNINYGRQQQANQFNAGIEQQNVAAQNQAQQLNLQIAMQEAEMNARNRAAKRNAARQAILNAATNIGQIGRENYFGKSAKETTGYYMNPTTGKMEYYNPTKE